MNPMTKGPPSPRCPLCGFAAPEGAPCPRCGGRAAPAPAVTVPHPSEGFLKAFTAGFAVFLQGFSFTARRPGLLKYVVIPLFICFVLFALMVWGGIALAPHVLGFLGGDWGLFEWLHDLLYWILYALLVLLLVVLAFLLTLILSTVINSPFYDLLSEKVEELHLGRRLEEPWDMGFFARYILLPVKESLKLALYQVGVSLLLFAVSLLSGGLGTVLFSVAGPYMAALSLFDFVMARKFYTLREKRAFLHKNLAFAMGFGLPASFLPFLTPFAVVGATLGFLACPVKS